MIVDKKSPPYDGDFLYALALQSYERGLFFRRDSIPPAFEFLFRNYAFVAHILIFCHLRLAASALPCIISNGVVNHYIMPMGNFLTAQK